MRLGPLEIVLIIAVIIAVAVIARIIRTGGATGQKKLPSTQIAANRPASSRLWNFLNRTGIVMVIAGVAGLIAAVGLFRWVLQSYLWAVIIMAIGFILVLFARKKR